MFTNNQKLGFGLLIFFIVYIIGVGVLGDQIAEYATTQTPIIQLLLYYLTQTQFMIILVGSAYIGLLGKKLFSGIGAGILLDLASDMSSTPHCVLQSGFIQNAPNLALCSDTILIHGLDVLLPHIISFWLYYVIIPVIFVIIAFELLGVRGFISYFKK